MASWMVPDGNEDSEMKTNDMAKLDIASGGAQTETPASIWFIGRFSTWHQLT